jgi:hypothetical protein
VPAALSAGPVVAVMGTKGGTGASENPWARLCAGGEISSAAAVTGVTASVAQQLKYVSVIVLVAVSFSWFCV